MTLATVRKPPQEALAQLEKVVIQGNLATLTENERIGYYARVCESLGLNPLTRPFEYITLNGKLTLYVRKEATDQLRQLHAVSIEKIERERDDQLGLITVTAYARDRYGRTDASIGVVSIKGLSGEALANALMKAETKARRRVTLSIVGLGWMDEVEALDQRAIEVAPRQSLTSAIASRTAALTGGNEPGESDASVPAGGAEAAEADPSSVAGSPDCAHDPKRHQTAEAGVVCGDCGTLLAEREAPAAKPRARAKAAAKPRQRKAPTEDGYQRARAHGIADKRGLDPDALKRIAGDVLGKEGDWSRTELDEEAWEYVANVVDQAPERLEDDKAWMDAATSFAGEAAIGADLASKLETDEDWAPIEKLAEELMGSPADKLDPNEWVELALRWAAKA